MPTASTSQNKIDQYLAELRSRLRHLPEEQVVDVVEEIRSHILDTAGSGETVTETGINVALGRLGPPSELAAKYVTDNVMARAESSGTPWSVLRGVFRWARLSATGFLVFCACLVGYAFGGSFFIAALVKPFNPKAGLWLVDQDTYSLTLGMSDRWPHGHELLGWKIIPIGLALGGGTILLTTHVGLWCIRRFRQTRPFGGLAGNAQ